MTRTLLTLARGLTYAGAWLFMQACIRLKLSLQDYLEELNDMQINTTPINHKKLA